MVIAAAGNETQGLIRSDEELTLAGNVSFQFPCGGQFTLPSRLINSNFNYLVCMFLVHLVMRLVARSFFFLILDHTHPANKEIVILTVQFKRN